MSEGTSNAVDFLYQKRPSKHVQRRAIVDALRRLSSLGTLPAYRYVGFGSYEFVDFELVHRDLGIDAMDSIEIEEAIYFRALDNAPFSSVAVHHDNATDALPKLLNRDERQIVWLDYVSRLDKIVLGDLKICARHLPIGSVLLVTIRCEPTDPFEEQLDAFRKAVGAERVPSGVGLAELGAGLGDQQRDVIVREAIAMTQNRKDNAELVQLFDVRYRDSTSMQTWGAIVAGPHLDETQLRATFSGLPQVAFSGDPSFEASVPPLTAREVLRLNEQLPSSKLEDDSIEQDALDAYKRLYRWYPPVPAPM